jgi:hypothetical protein
MKERSVACEAFSDTVQVTLFRCYRNFQTWYELEIFKMSAAGKLEGSKTICKEFSTVDKAFDSFDWYVTKHELKILETKGA